MRSARQAGGVLVRSARNGGPAASRISTARIIRTGFLRSTPGSGSMASNLSRRTSFSRPSSSARKAGLGAIPVSPTKTGTGFSSVISAEVPCQLLPLDQEPSRTAVRAGDRFLRRLEICQQPALLGDIKRVAESHRGMARERRGRLLDCTIAPVLGEGRQGFLDGGCGPSKWQLGRDGGDAQGSSSVLLLLDAEVL